MLTEEDDIEQIYQIVCNYTPMMLYREVYHVLLDQSRQNGSWDENLGILDKWLWKYQFYTVEQFMNSIGSGEESDWEPTDSDWESDEY